MEDELQVVVEVAEDLGFKLTPCPTCWVPSFQAEGVFEFCPHCEHTTPAKLPDVPQEPLSAKADPSIMLRVIGWFLRRLGG